MGATRIAKRVGVVAAALVVAAAMGLGVRLRGESAVLQPLAFPHKAHLELKEQKLECKSCHEGVETRVAAGRPSTRKCLSCHSGEAKGAEERKLQAFADRKQEVPWQRIWRLPPDVFFSHRQHVTVAKVECQTCHGDMASLDRPPVRPLRALGMADCTGCHETWRWPKDTPSAQAGRRIPDDCAACHR